MYGLCYETVHAPCDPNKAHDKYRLTPYVACATLRYVSNAELLTSRQVAEMFQVSVATVSRWARDGHVPSIRTPAGRRRFRREDVEAALALIPARDDKAGAA